MIMPYYTLGMAGAQDVRTHEYLESDGIPGTTTGKTKKGLTWTIGSSSTPGDPNDPSAPPPSSTGGKQDADDTRVKLKGVRIRATCYEPATEDYPGFSYNQVKTTDSRGRIDRKSVV